MHSTDTHPHTLTRTRRAHTRTTHANTRRLHKDPRWTDGRIQTYKHTMQTHIIHRQRGLRAAAVPADDPQGALVRPRVWSAARGPPALRPASRPRGNAGAGYMPVPPPARASRLQAGPRATGPRSCRRRPGLPAPARPGRRQRILRRRSAAGGPGTPARRGASPPRTSPPLRVAVAPWP